MVKYEISRPSVISHNPREVCLDMGISSPVLVEIKSALIVDCMGTEIDASDFCRKKYKFRKDLLRGAIDQQDKKVLCQFGESAILSLECTKKYESLCTNEEQGCKTLKDIFAVSLQVIHQSVVESHDSKIISCYFGPLDSDLLKFNL